MTFYSNQAGTQPAGSVTITSQTAPGAYPLTARIAGQLPTLPLAFTLTVTINDSSATSGSIQGSMSSGSVSLSNISLAFSNLDVASASGTLTGSLTISDSVGTATFTNIVANVSGGSAAISCNFSLSGFSGNIVINADGSGTMTINDSGGTSHVTWNSSGQGSITYPDGTTASVTL